jgi:hypothetical protein
MVNAFLDQNHPATVRRADGECSPCSAACSGGRAVRNAAARAGRVESGGGGTRGGAGCASRSLHLALTEPPNLAPSRADGVAVCSARMAILSRRAP